MERVAAADALRRTAPLEVAACARHACAIIQRFRRVPSLGVLAEKDSFTAAFAALIPLGDEERTPPPWQSMPKKAATDRAAITLHRTKVSQKPPPMSSLSAAPPVRFSRAAGE